MTWNKGYIVTQWPEPLADGVNQGGMIASGQITATYRALKQYVTNQGELVLRLVKNYVARCMSWAVQHIQGALSYLDLITLG